MKIDRRANQIQYMEETLERLYNQYDNTEDPNKREELAIRIFGIYALKL